jgi:hypothetical protein
MSHPFPIFLVASSFILHDKRNDDGQCPSGPSPEGQHVQQPTAHGGTRRGYGRDVAASQRGLTIAGSRSRIVSPLRIRRDWRPGGFTHHYGTYGTTSLHYHDPPHNPKPPAAKNRFLSRQPGFFLFILRHRRSQDRGLMLYGLFSARAPWSGRQEAPCQV